jgi:hypothetical protein
MCGPLSRSFLVSLERQAPAMFKRPWGPFAVMAALLSSAAFVGRARADASPTTAQLTAARALFMEAERDEDALRWQDALEKLGRVSAVKLTSGVRYHTAFCEEHLGQLLAALHDYRTAASQAREENAVDVLRLVDKRILDASARVPQLTIVLAPSLQHAAVRLDGQAVSAGVSLPVDPGTHHIDAEAPEHAPSTWTVTLEERAVISLEVKLEPTSPSPASPPPVAPTADAVRADSIRPRAPETARSRDRTVAIVAGAGALGLAAGGIGAYIAAGHAQTDSIQTCAQVTSLDPNACASQKSLIRTWDWVAVAAWTAAAGAGAIAVVSLAKPRRDAAAGEPARVVLGPARVTLEGSF